jgi:hypothetical protein
MREFSSISRREIANKQTDTPSFGHIQPKFPSDITLSGMYSKQINTVARLPSLQENKNQMEPKEELFIAEETSPNCCTMANEKKDDLQRKCYNFKSVQSNSRELKLLN